MTTTLPARTPPQRRIVTRGRAVTLAVVAAVLAAMVLSTTWWPVGKEIPGAPVEFDSDDWAAENYDGIAQDITARAVALDEVAAALAEDPQAAGEQFGQRSGAGSFTYAVEVTGTAGEARGGLLPVEVPGLPRGTTVSVQVGPAINGTALRDATGAVSFNDFVNQLDYANAAIGLNERMKATVLADIEPGSLAGRTVTVIGATAPLNPQLLTVTPISLEESS